MGELCVETMKLRQFKNAYCDAVGLALGEFMDIRAVLDESDIVKRLSEEDLSKICEYAVIKNKLAGVGELNLKVTKEGIAIPFFEKYQMNGKEILSARLIDCLSAKDFVGGRIIIEVESLMEYNEDYLSKIVDFCASTDTPVLVKMGQTLEEVGKVVNRFNHSPAEVLEDYGFLDRECLIYGLNFLDKEDQKLLKNYNPTLVLSPKDDGESGRGAINLYNLVFNQLKFNFASGKCYEVDMILEAKLAILNTANLMYERDLVSVEEAMTAIQGSSGELLIEIEDSCEKATVLDRKVDINDINLKARLAELRDSLKQIAKNLR